LTQACHRFYTPLPPRIGHVWGDAELAECDRLIGEALEITIVVSMLVLVVYPSTILVMEALQGRRSRRNKVVQDRRRRDQR